MATINWPNTLPDGLLMEGLAIEPQNNVIRTRMDAGPNKARRRYTASTTKFTGIQRFDAAEFDAFKTFFHTTVADGVLRFNFTDPHNLETAEFRFCENYHATAVEGYYEVAMSLERL